MLKVADKLDGVDVGYYITSLKVNGDHVHRTLTKGTILEHRESREPILTAINKVLDGKLFPRRRRRSYWEMYDVLPERVDATISIEIGVCDKPVDNTFVRSRDGFREYYVDAVGKYLINYVYLVMERRNNLYFINGVKYSKKVIVTALSRALNKSLYPCSKVKMYNYIMDCLETPENITHALENRAPYYFWKEARRVEVRLPLEKISDKKYAIEISDGIWGEINQKDLNTFLNVYLHHHKRSKWYRCSPVKLWTELMGEEPSESELMLMIEFLDQNRTAKMVEDKAKELLMSLGEEHPDRIKIKTSEKYGILVFVRGKVTDWLLYESSGTAGMQKVTTCAVKYGYREDGFGRHDEKIHAIFKENNIKLGHNICIDNLNHYSSLGDQFASRAIALMNDSIMLQRIGTLTWDGEEVRFIWENLGDNDEL